MRYGGGNLEHRAGRTRRPGGGAANGTAARSSTVATGTRRVVGTWTLGLAVLAAGLAIGGREAGAADRPPPATRSWYARSVEPTVFAREGCATGRMLRAAAPQQRFAVVVIFGGFGRTERGWTFDLYSKQAAPASAVEGAVAAYLDGVERCRSGATRPRLTLVVGTTTSLGEVSAEAGTAFARLIDDLERRIDRRNAAVTLLAGNDIELGYVGPRRARAWMDGYHAATRRTLVNYGDLAGCPSNRVPVGGDCGSAAYPEWSVEDVWHVAGHPNTINLPSNYVITGVQARQWQALSRYGLRRHGRPLRFLGVLSQIAACRERPCSRLTKNSPDAAWRQLRTALAADARLGPADLVVSDIAWMPLDAPPRPDDVREAANDVLRRR